MKSKTYWLICFLFAAIIGVALGYFITLVFRPSLIPPALRLGGLKEPSSLLLMGVDIVYTGERRRLKADLQAFNGRSDTMMFVYLNPKQNKFTILSIPRDTLVSIPGYGKQKINSANALGGEYLALRTVQDMLGLPCDHYIVLNVHGLVELVDALGGINVQIPKRMRYRDNAAKLKIDLQPGPHLLNGNEAMGFVRFRHDALGDIGRVQRQELFIQAVMSEAAKPSSWAKVPQLLGIATKYIKTDLSVSEMMQILNFVRTVPKLNQRLVMMPGNFSAAGDWLPDNEALAQVVSSMQSDNIATLLRSQIKVSIENSSSKPGMARKLSKYLSTLGYQVQNISNRSENFPGPISISKIVAEQCNPEAAQMLRNDLQKHGEIINASLGDIQSSLTLVVGDDLVPFVVSQSNRETTQ